MRANVVEQDESSITLVDRDRLTYWVHSSGVEVQIGRYEGEAAFRVLWEALRTVARNHPCIASWFDYSNHVHVGMETRLARRRYNIV